MIYRYFKVTRRDMVYLKFILEAYEGMNVMSTVDNKAGIIRISIMPGFVQDIDDLLATLGMQVRMEPVEWNDEQSSATAPKLSFRQASARIQTLNS